MTGKEAIKVLLDEWKCIDRNDGINCDRKCEKCDLVMDSGILKEAYNTAIKALEQEPCDDVVSRQAVLDEIDDTNRRGGFGCKLSYTRCRVHIEQLPSVRPQEPKWIPVSERLPEEREWHLAVFKEIDTGYQLIPRVADYIGAGKNEWRLIDEDGLAKEYRDILECIAWMPLPKPYEPQESEDKE